MKKNPNILIIFVYGAKIIGILHLKGIALIDVYDFAPLPKNVKQFLSMYPDPLLVISSKFRITDLL
jgi:hypothetical protein